MNVDLESSIDEHQYKHTILACMGVLSADKAVKPTMSLKYIVTQS